MMENKQNFRISKYIQAETAAEEVGRLGLSSHPGSLTGPNFIFPGPAFLAELEMSRLWILIPESGWEVGGRVLSAVWKTSKLWTS